MSATGFARGSMDERTYSHNVNVFQIQVLLRNIKNDEHVRQKVVISAYCLKPVYQGRRMQNNNDNYLGIPFAHQNNNCCIKGKGSDNFLYKMKIKQQ